MSQYDKDNTPKLLIEHMREGNSFISFCARHSIPRRTAYNWLEKHPEFKEAKEIGDKEAQSWWEDLGRTLALKGNSAVYIFNMKNRFGWTDKRGLDVGVTGQIEHKATPSLKIDGFDDTEKAIELKFNSKENSYDREET